MIFFLVSPGGLETSGGTGETLGIIAKPTTVYPLARGKLISGLSNGLSASAHPAAPSPSRD